MKKVFFIIGILLISLNVFAQSKINTDNLIGYWRCLDYEATELFFWKDVNGKLQVQEISSTSGRPLDTITFRIDENTFFLRTFFVPTNYVSENTFTFIDKNTLRCDIDAKHSARILYTKIK